MQGLGVRAYAILYRSLTDPVGTLADLDELRRDWPPPRPPDFDLLMHVAEAQALWRSGDRRRAEDVLVALLDGHPSIYTFGPLASLVTMRISSGDLDGADRVLTHVENDPYRLGRIGLLACETRRSELLTAQGDLPEAAAMLPHAVEAIRDRRLAFYPAADQHWLEAAGYLATSSDASTTPRSSSRWPSDCSAPRRVRSSPGPSRRSTPTTTSGVPSARRLPRSSEHGRPPGRSDGNS